MVLLTVDVLSDGVEYIVGSDVEEMSDAVVPSRCKGFQMHQVVVIDSNGENWIVIFLYFISCRSSISNTHAVRYYNCECNEFT